MKQLKKRRLGRSNLMVTELGFGAMNIPDVEQGEETLHKALELGINFIDTGRAYKHSEYLIGQVLKTRKSQRSGFYIASKALSRSMNGALNDIDKSLKYLGVDKIDLYQLHDVEEGNWDQVMAKDGALQGLRYARERGLIDYIGISSHKVAVLRRAIDSEDFDTVQLMYSPFNRETGNVIPLAKERDIGIIVMKPLGGAGMLGTLKLSQYRTSLTAKMLLRYALSNPHISVVIPGVRFPWEVEENVELAASYEPLTTAEISLCNEQANSLFSTRA